MSAFKFIKSHKSLTNSNLNVQVPIDNDFKSKNIDNSNNAPAQPAQSFNVAESKRDQNPPKKGFNFIKRKQNIINNNLEKSNSSVNSNEQKISVNNNNLNPETDLNSLINNTNNLLNFGSFQKNEENINNNNNNINNANINNLAEVTYQNLENIEEDNSNSQKKENYFNNNLNFSKPDFVTNNNNVSNNFEEREKVIDKPKEKKSGFSFLIKKNKKNNFNMNNGSESDSNQNIPYIANKTPLSSSMSDKLSDKGMKEGYMNINQEAAETENDLMNNNEDNYQNINSLNNSNSNNNFNVNETNDNNYNKFKGSSTPEKKEEIKEKEISEISINARYKIKKDNFINDYIKFINELHSKKLVLQNKESELASLNNQKENLIKEEQKAIDDNDYERADNIENRIKNIKNKSNEISLKIEEETNLLMNIQKKEIQINNNLLIDLDNVSSGYNTLKIKLEEKIENFNNNEMAKHEGENIRLEKLKEKLEFLKSNLEQEKTIIDTEESKIDTLIKGQSAGIFESLENLNKDKKVILDEIEEIKKKLQIKEKELEKINIKIDNKQKEIDAVKSNFNYEYKKIEIKKKNYEDNMKDYEEQNERYNTELKLFKQKDIENKSIIGDLDKELTYLNDKIKVNQQIYMDKKEDINKKETLINDENDYHKKIFDINKKMNEINLKIESHHSKIQVLNVNNKIMQGEINQIEIKLPSLEEEKKSYISIKNFKEAGRVSKELKDSLEKKNINIEKIEKNKKDIEKFESELKKYQEEIENYESENQKLEKELDVYKYKNLINAVNTMNYFYENEQKDSKILEEIKLTKEQIDKLRLKEHVIKYIQENANDIGDTNKNEIKKDEDDYNIKTEKISQNIFKGLNTNITNEKETFKKEDEDGNYTGFNLMDNDKDEILGENKENKIKELNEKIQNAVNVSL